jgi:hypothetical protein
MTWESIYFKIFVAIQIFLFSCVSLIADDNPVNASYRERINIHLGRDTYISGESIWFKAYCFSNRKDPADFLSKALYVELINDKHKAVLMQVLEINDNTAASVLQIPDTITTGLYYLTGYTQWMRNFNHDNFFSQPVFIYNQYDENAAGALANYQLPLNPEIYIEGGKLIMEVGNRIILKIPGLFGKQMSGYISETYSREILQSFRTDKFGVIEFDFMPKSGAMYDLVIGDSVLGTKSIRLPQAEFSGYVVHPLSYKDSKIYLSVNGSNVPPDAVVLVAAANGKSFTQLNITRDLFGKEISLAIPDNGYPIIQLQLQTKSGKLLAGQNVILNYSEPVEVKDLKKVYGSNEKVDFEIIPGIFNSSELVGLSASVYKKEASGDSATISDTVQVDGNLGYLLLKNLISVFPRFPLSSDLINNQSALSDNEKFPVEDVGMLYTGTVFNSVNNTPVKGIEVNLAIHDTIPAMYSSRTDSLGKFTFLINEYNNHSGYINLLFNELPLSGNYSVEIDDKFNYFSGMRNPSIYLPNNPEFIKQMKDEAQRVLIQRAFRNNDLQQSSMFPVDSHSVVPFYGKPLMVVFPEEYFMLPNFEEIAREILPRVKFRQSKSGCDLTIIDIENNIKSEHPIILLDGIPVNGPCDLYPLNSDDIDRIEIQSGYRVSGNLLYNGLIAVFTTDKYKEKNKAKNGRTSYFIPGYINNTNVLSYAPENNNSNQRSAPDFKNQLYWNPDLQLQSGADLGFTTTDEEGDYILDVFGYTKTGCPLHIYKIFNVSDL